TEMKQIYATQVFFFQAEDGIRAFHVTGVQTCALPILSTAASFVLAVGIVAILVDAGLCFLHGRRARANPWRGGSLEWALPVPVRSEERRVGKEWSGGPGADH